MRPLMRCCKWENGTQARKKLLHILAGKNTDSLLHGVIFKELHFRFRLNRIDYFSLNETEGAAPQI